MDTSTILIWGAGLLAATIVLCIFFSKRNNFKKEKMNPPREYPEDARCAEEEDKEKCYLKTLRYL